MFINSKNILRYSLCLSLVLTLMILATIPAFGNIVRGPWVQGVTTSSIYVLAECDSTATATVRYGLTTSYGGAATTETIESTQAGETPVYNVHNVKLTGLTANTLYHYQILQGSSISADKTFYTAVNPGTGFRMALMGDCRSNATTHGTIASRIKAANPRLSLYPGDLANDYHTATWHNEFWVANELALDESVPFYNAPGNHEGWKTNTFAFTHGSGTNKYYSFDYGDMHVLVLSNYDTDYSVGSAQYNFAMSDLTSSAKPWKIVIYHNPAYTYSSHPSDTIMQAYANNIFIPNGVKMVVTGHNHCYERIAMNGIKHITMGGGGAGLYAVSSGEGTEKAESTYCYGIVDVTATTLSFVAYRSDGTTLDSFTLPTGPQPTPTPTKTPTQTPLSQLSYTFTSNAEGWTGGTSGKQYDAAVWDGSTGNPAGSLKLDGSDLGTPDPTPNAWFYKSIALPANTVNLTFFVKSADATHDGKLQVRLVDANNVSHTLYAWTTISGGTWQYKIASISAYAGQTVTIYFEQNDSGQGSGEQLYIDNVNITTIPPTPTLTVRTPAPSLTPTIATPATTGTTPGPTGTATTPAPTTTGTTPAPSGTAKTPAPTPTISM